MQLRAREAARDESNRAARGMALHSAKRSYLDSPHALNEAQLQAAMLTTAPRQAPLR